MNCMKNIQSTPLPHDLFLKTARLYKSMGMDVYYDGLFEKKKDFYTHKTAEENAKAFYQFFVPDFKPIPPSRLHQLTLDSSTAHSKSEQLFKNILLVFQKIHYDSYESFELNLAETRELLHYLFKDVRDYPKYRTKKNKESLFNSKKTSYREIYESYLDDVQKVLNKDSVEPIFLYANFLVDFINLKVYDFDYNHLLGSLIFYILMIESGLNVSYYISFFPKLLLKKESYLKLLHQSSFQWEEGLSEVVPLTKFMIDIYESMYEDLEEISRDIHFEKDMSILKTDFIENIILKMPETFSKRDIRKKNPHVSDSTINRTLKRLQEENKIRSLGKGRSAKWVKIIDQSYEKGQLKFQLDDQKS